MSRPCSPVHFPWDPHYKLQPIYHLFWVPGNKKACNSVSLWLSGPLILLDFQAEICYSSSLMTTVLRNSTIDLILKMAKPMKKKKAKDLWTFKSLHPDTLSDALTIVPVNLKSSVRNASIAIGNFSPQGKIPMVKPPGTCCYWPGSLNKDSSL